MAGTAARTTVARKPRLISRFRAGLGVAITAGTALALLPAAAQAAPPGIGCSVSALKAAITTANATPGHQTITLTPGCTYNLAAADNAANGLPVITGDIAVQGRGATIRRAGAAAPFRLIKVADGGTLSLTDLSLTGGLAKDDCADDPFGFIVACGGAIENLGTLTVERASISNSAATSGSADSILLEGGGIENFGTATLKTVLFTGNSASYTGTAADSFVSGGAISNEGDITIDGATVVASSVSSTGSGEQFVPAGGEVYGSAFINFGTASLTRILVSGNRASAASNGAVNSAVYNYAGDLTLANAIITLNTVDAPGGIAAAAGLGTRGSTGHLVVTDSSISLNRSTAISSGPPPDCSSSQFGAVGSGGGVQVLNTPVEISRTSIVGNVVRSTGGCAVARGGGIYNVNGTVHLTSVVVRGNQAIGDTAVGGGIYNRTTKGLTVDQSSITDNTASGTSAAGGGINNAPGSLATLTNTVVAHNKPDNCNPAIGTCVP